ncbi:MAG: biopolymer transporter ExbD [Burkholderiales bacterium]|nr:biopolymer transporter ExbD [Burkholderiales bacterium]
MRVRRLRKPVAHLEITAFINLIVVLVPFLLSTAVFTHLAVLDLKLPAAEAAADALAHIEPGKLQLELVLRRDAYEVGDRIGGLIERIPRAGEGRQAQSALTALLVQIKARYPQVTTASLLAEPETPYDDLVQAMDALRATVSARGAQVVRSELFPQIAIGDAPQRRGP